MAVVAAGELDDEIAARRTARQTDGAHDRFSARGHKAHLLKPGITSDDRFGEFDFDAAGRAEGRAERGFVLDDFDHFGMAVAEDQGAPGLHEVEVAIAFFIDNIGTLAARHKTRRAADSAESAHGRVDAAGDRAPGAFIQFGVGLFAHERFSLGASFSFRVSATPLR